MTNANNEEREELVEDENEEAETYEATTNTEETTETAEESATEEPAEETVTISKSDYDKIKREAAAAARLRGKSKEGSKEDSKEGVQGYDQDLISRTFLAAQAGITDPEVQDEALRLAKKFDMKIDEAMKDTDIATRIQNIQKQNQAQKGIAGNGGGAGSKPRGIEHYAQEFKRTGRLPDDPKLVSKILDELTK